MGNSVGDYPGLPAPGPGQDQQGPFGVLGGLPLAWVQPLQKIHEVAILARTVGHSLASSS